MVSGRLWAVLAGWLGTVGANAGTARSGRKNRRGGALRMMR